jgi:hypothetical protein
VGVPNAHSNIGGIIADAGGLHVLYGSGGGLTALGSQWFDQSTPYVANSSEPDDHFGAALAAGDLNGDGYDDLVIGVPDEDLDGVVDAGGANVLYGSAAGLSTTAEAWFDQATPGVYGAIESGDTFGASLATGDLDGDGYADVAFGVPGEDVEGVNDAGGVSVLYGTSSGLASTGSYWLDQGLSGMGGTREAGDWFGHRLAAGDLNADGYDDLAVGTPREGFGDVMHAGGVNVLYATAEGVSATISTWFTQDTPGLYGTLEESDGFGNALAIWPRGHTVYLPLVVR